MYYSGLGKGGAAVQIAAATPEVQVMAADAAITGDKASHEIASQVAIAQSLIRAKQAKEVAVKPKSDVMTYMLIGGVVLVGAYFLLRKK